VLTAVSSTTNEVCSEMSSLPVNLSVTVWPTGASFIAAHPGTASITSIRLACPPPPPNAWSASGVMECGAILGFRVSVRVS
jgi:hypothetical protein